MYNGLSWSIDSWGALFKGRIYNPYKIFFRAFTGASEKYWMQCRKKDRIFLVGEDMERKMAPVPEKVNKLCHPPWNHAL